MAGPTALVFGTKKSISSTLGKNLQKFLSGHGLDVFAAETPKDILGRGPFTYAILVCEEPVPPPTLNVWFKSFAPGEAVSDRLFLLAKNELPAAWQENLPFESSFEESNYQAVLEEIIDPGKHSMKVQFPNAGSQVAAQNPEFKLGPSDSASGMFSMSGANPALSESSDDPSTPPSADDHGFFSAESNISLDTPDAEPEVSKTPSARPTPPPPSMKKVAPTALKLGVSFPAKSPTEEVATRMAPLPEASEAPIGDEAQFSLDEAAPQQEQPSVQFDLSEDTSAAASEQPVEEGNLEPMAEDQYEAPVAQSGEDLSFDGEVESESANEATRVSKQLGIEAELPAAKKVKLSLSKIKDNEQKPLTGSIRLEALEHPEGTRLNEPLAGRGDDVNMDDLAIEANHAPTEDPSFNLADHEPVAPAASSGEDFEFDSSLGSPDEPVEEAAPSSASKSELKTLEKYLAIKDRELRERESNIKILKGQIQKTEAKLAKSDEARRSQALKLDETQAEVRALREESEQKAFALSKVEDLHREEMKALQARMESALFEANKAGKRLDEFRERVKQDIQKIRAQERELANKLEIQKRDADALLGAKDEKLMAQRREIDQLQFELDNLKERLVEETEKAEERSKRLSRALSSLKLAQGMLSGIKEEVVPSSENDSDSNDGEAA